MKILLLALILFLPGFAQTKSDSVQRADRLTGFPAIYYTPETRWAFGAGGLYVYRPELTSERASAATASIFYTQNKQFIVEFTTNVMVNNGSLWHQGNFFYQKFPNTFYGIGNSTPDSGKETFTAEIVRLNPALMTRIADRLYGGILFHYETWNLQNTLPGKLLSTGIVPGSGATTVTGVGMLFNYDERDNLFAPMKGRYYQAGFIASPEFLGSTYGFTRTRIDLREYFSLGGSHVVAAQGIFHSTTGTVPFRFLPQIGGQNVMRGYFEGRYRDNHMATVQAEYRSPFLYRIGFALFGSAGDVAHSLKDFSTGTLKFAYGVGIRVAFIPEEYIILRVDYGMGKNSNGVYITFNEAI
jgi:hypothetical protein